MPVTFVADLNALVDALRRSLRDRGLGRETRRAARAKHQGGRGAGLAAVRSLNTVVINHLGDDEVTRAVWARERRIVYPGRTDATPAPVPMPAAPESPSGNKAA